MADNTSAVTVAERMALADGIKPLVKSINGITVKSHPGEEPKVAAPKNVGKAKPAAPAAKKRTRIEEYRYLVSEVVPDVHFFRLFNRERSRVIASNKVHKKVTKAIAAEFNTAFGLELEPSDLKIERIAKIVR